MTAQAVPGGGLFPDRFRVIERIGEGSMGVVYRLHDEKTQHSVAAKTLRPGDPEALYRIKHEFRTLVELRHPNLVRLLELYVDDTRAFFTMELVNGTSFVDHVRGGDRLHPWTEANSEHLRDLMAQLVSALNFLHAAGKIHRDVKPGNVLVERGGRVVVLDFGLVSDLLSFESIESRVGVIAGTLPYMAPEQLAGHEVGPAADWYSVGVVLYETLCGTLPFPGQDLLALLARDHAPPPSPRSKVPDVPADLDALAVDLLAPRAGDRPGGQQILARLGTGRSALGPRLQSEEPRRSVFVGRRAELAALAEALANSRQGSFIARLNGASGIGKTMLVEHFLGSLAAGDATVFRSRCHPHENVPFKAVDGLVDGLVRSLSRRAPAEVEALVPRGVAAFVRMFPVATRLAEFVAAAQMTPLAAEPHEQRRQAFGALRELLGRLAVRRPLVLWIDDVQWSDPDSAALLREVYSGADSPATLLILSSRSDPESVAGSVASPIDEAVAELRQQSRTISLAPLGDAEVGALADAELGPSVATGPIRQAVVRDAGGNPFLALELARFLRHRPSSELGGRDHGKLLHDLIGARVETLRLTARTLLEHLAVAGHPLSEAVLRDATGGTLDFVDDLGEQRLTRLVPYQGEVALWAYHDAVAEAVLARVPSERRQEIHAQIATALQRLPGRQDENLVEHLALAGDVRAAANAAYELGEGAFTVAAFNRAASLYTRAITLGADRSPRWVLLERLAESLVNAGRSAEAAPRFLEAAEALETEGEQDCRSAGLRRRAASEFLRSGLQEQGLNVLRDACRRSALAFPESNMRALWWIMSNRVAGAVSRRLRRPPVATGGQPASVDAERLELAWAAGQGLSFVDLTRAAAFQARHAALARRSGHPGHLARSLSTGALFGAWERGDRAIPRSMALLVEAERLAARSGTPIVIAHVLLMRSTVCFVRGQWREALRLAHEGERLCREQCHEATWELVSFQQNILAALVHMGEVGRARILTEAAIHEAAERGNHFADAVLPVGVPNLAWLGADDPEQAERRVHDAIGPPFEEANYWYLYQGEYSRVHIDLYRGDGLAALQRVSRLWKELRRSWFARLPVFQGVLHDLRAKCAVFAAERQVPSGNQRDRLIESAARDANGMSRCGIDWYAPYVHRSLGAVAALRGDREAARVHLERAALGFEHLEMGLLAAGARWRLGGLGDDTQRGAAAAWMRAHGVANPECMAPLC
jgi:hypothetical protein